MYSAIFDHAPDGILYTDTDGNILNMNRRAGELFGVDPDRCITKTVDAIVFDDRGRACISGHLMTVVSNQIVSMIDLGIITDAGLNKNIEIHSSPVHENESMKGVISIIREITDRPLQGDSATKDDKFKTIFDNANDGIVYLDRQAVILASNKKIEELFGYSSDDIIGRKFIEFPIFASDDMNYVYDVYRQSFKGQLPPLLEFHGMHKNGEQFYLEINPTLIKEDGHQVGVLAILRDITPRKRSEEERARLIDIIEVTPDLVFTYDTYGNISYINRAGRDFFGLCEGNDFSLSSLPNIQEVLSLVRLTGIWTGESRVVSKNNESVQVSQVIMSHCNSEGDNAYFSMIMRDISDQKQNENHIKFLTHHLLRMQEDERLRLSRDLHDNLAQDLSSLKIICDTLSDCDSDGTKNNLSKMSQIIKQSIGSIRDIIYNLRPATLNELGLVNTLYRFCEEFKNSHTEVSFHTAGMEQVKLDFDAEINIYRIAQEAFNNIKKHAQARRITVNLTASYPTIIFQIEDNGRGFEPNKRKKELLHEKRMGLKSMEERVGLLNGTFKIQSKVSVGTIIHVEVPYKPDWLFHNEMSYSVKG